MFFRGSPYPNTSVSVQFLVKLRSLPLRESRPAIVLCLTFEFSAESESGEFFCSLQPRGALIPRIQTQLCCHFRRACDGLVNQIHRSYVKEDSNGRPSLSLLSLNFTPPTLSMATENARASTTTPFPSVLKIHPPLSPTSLFTFLSRLMTPCQHTTLCSPFSIHPCL